MKTITQCLLFVMVAVAAAARPNPKPAPAHVQQARGTAVRTLVELPAGFSPLPMPAIYIPEFGKEFTFADLEDVKAPTNKIKMADLPHMEAIPPPATPDWPHTQGPATKAQQWAMKSTLLLPQALPADSDDSSENNNQQVSDQTADQTQESNNSQEQKQGNQQQLPATGADCSKTDTSADAVMRCVNAVRTNPQAFTSDYPCSSPWLNTISSPARSTLRDNSKLDASAQRQANDMARNSRINHVGSDGSSVGERIKDAGYTTFPQAENIAMGQTSAHQVAMEWMCSEGHRKAIMSCEYDEVGTAVAQNGGTWYYAQNFGCSSGNCPKCDVA